MKRSHENEMMDRAGNSPVLLAGELRNLRLLNRYARGSHSVLLALWRMLGREPLKHLSILDIGTGSADIPTAILVRAKRRRLDAKIVGMDADPLTDASPSSESGSMLISTSFKATPARHPFRPALSITSSHRSFFITSPRRK